MLKLAENAGRLEKMIKLVKDHSSPKPTSRTRSGSMSEDSVDTAFHNTRRIKGEPIRKRIGDDLLERTEGGHVSYYWGYYTPSQVLARKQFAEKMETILINRLIYEEVR